MASNRPLDFVGGSAAKTDNTQSAFGIFQALDRSERVNMVVGSPVSATRVEQSFRKSNAISSAVQRSLASAA
jgi:hypothetical protein